MEYWIPLLGLLCVAYTLLEFGAALRRGQGRSRPAAAPQAASDTNSCFGAVDVESGRPVALVVDRRRDAERRAA